MDKKQLLQSLLFKIPALKHTKRQMRFRKIESAFKTEQVSHRVLGLGELRHPN